MNLDEAIELYKNKVDYILIYKNKNNTEEHVYDGLIDREHFTERVFRHLSRMVTNHELGDNYLRVVLA